MTWLAACTRPCRWGTVGRVAERVMLCEKIDALATRGDAHTVVVEGESGIGKSTLVKEVVKTVKQAGVPVQVLAVTAESLARGCVDNNHSTDFESPPHPARLYEHSHSR